MATSRISIFGFFILFVCLAETACVQNSKEKLLGSICDTSDTKFSSFVNPLMVSKCLSCHNNVSASGGISVEGYTNVKNHYAAILASVKDGSMPQGSSKLDACTITKIETWISKGAQNN